MEIGHHIHELLLENDLVVIPGFGAFISEYKPAEINAANDEIKPPANVITFNSQIRNNDGLLVGYVAEEKRISHFDALKKIEKEREDILYKLDRGEEVELDEIGILFPAPDNTIGFKATDDDKLLLDAYGLEPASLLAAEVSEEPKEVEILITDDASPDPEPEKTVEELTTDIEGEAIKEEEDVAVLTPTIPPTETEEEVSEPEDNSKKRGWLWLFLVLIPLIGVSVFVYLRGNFGGETNSAQLADKKISSTLPGETVVDSLADSSEREELTDSILVTAEDTFNTEKIVPTVSEPEGPEFCLVGGSFSVEENADDYLKELTAKGVNAFRAGKKGRFFIIGIGSYPTFNDAEKARQEYMNNNPESEVWVWKRDN